MMGIRPALFLLVLPIFGAGRRYVSGLAVRSVPTLCCRDCPAGTPSHRYAGWKERQLDLAIIPKRKFRYSETFTTFDLENQIKNGQDF